MLTEKNFLTACLTFEKRQAGVSVIFCPQKNRYFYHAYCLEKDLLKDLLSLEFLALEEALSYINDEFNGWKVTEFKDNQKNCGTCHAK
ncbi:MAG: hypothetical protein OXC44_06610 [Proteobacteria bacterium]|nr:hypothetical protein [Pseudomonadota bacterium]